MPEDRNGPESHNMRRVRQIHFVGIGGAGMSGIAEVLHNLGYEVTGTDLRRGGTTDRLAGMGVEVRFEHRAESVDGSDVVVYSSAVPADNPELLAARRQRIPIIPRAEMLSELMRFREGVAVAGTHGKTTTTSLIASLLAEGMYDPTYIIGGRLNMTGSHARLGKGKYIVAEADESDASFLHLSPVYAVLTNIDADHLEYHGGSYQALQNNFIDFLHCLPFYGLVVICGDDAGIREILPRINRPYVTYGIDSDSDYRAQAIEYDGPHTSFDIVRRDGDDPFRVTLSLPGRHNVLNALAATALATELGISQQAIGAGLANFQGIARRSSILGEIRINGKTVLMIDDYAHHPSEISGHHRRAGRRLARAQGGGGVPAAPLHPHPGPVRRVLPGAVGTQDIAPARRVPRRGTTHTGRRQPLPEPGAQGPGHGGAYPCQHRGGTAGGAGKRRRGQRHPAAAGRRRHQRAGRAAARRLRGEY